MRLLLRDFVATFVGQRGPVSAHFYGLSRPGHQSKPVEIAAGQLRNDLIAVVSPVEWGTKLRLWRAKKCKGMNGVALREILAIRLIYF